MAIAKIRIQGTPENARYKSRTLLRKPGKAATTLNSKLSTPEICLKLTAHKNPAFFGLACPKSLLWPRMYPK
jgi:hypothetical protein